MSGKKATSSGSKATDSSRSSGPLSLRYNDEASYRAFMDQLENEVRMSYGEIACFVFDRKYPFRSFPNRERALALCLEGEMEGSDEVGSSQHIVTSSVNVSGAGSSVSAGTRGNARANASGNSNVSSNTGHAIDPEQVSEMLRGLTKEYARLKIKDISDKQRIYGMIMAALDQNGLQAVKSDPDFKATKSDGCPLRLLNIIQKTHVNEIGIVGSKSDAFARISALETLLSIHQKQGQSLLSYKESFLLAVQRMESLKCTNIPGGEELASRFMIGADSNIYSQCIWDLKNSNRLNPLIGMPDTVEKAYDHLIRPLFSEGPDSHAQFW